MTHLPSPEEKNVKYALREKVSPCLFKLGHCMKVSAPQMRKNRNATHEPTHPPKPRAPLSPDQEFLPRAGRTQVTRSRLASHPCRLSQSMCRLGHFPIQYQARGLTRSDLDAWIYLYESSDRGIFSHIYLSG